MQPVIFVFGQLPRRGAGRGPGFRCPAPGTARSSVRAGVSGKDVLGIFFLREATLKSQWI